ncbi:MAG: MlaD family protein [Rhodococcus sp. (in: high G+C Gram-positive bacteria)]|uniref:MCE family protein n=1 Tax=Rhodococcus sp. TaxID=1831 RepID=UPI003BB77CEB
MSYRKSLIGLSLFLVVCCALAWTVLVTLQRGVQGPTNSYSAAFSDASGLRIGDDVRMAGVRVGRIDSIALVGATAKVGFRIDAGQVVYGNTKAAITYQNIIGQRYLGLSLGDFGDSRILPAGSEIPLEHTEPSFDISVLLNGFEPLFSVLDPEQVDNITTAIITALQGDSGSVTTLVAETTRLAESVAGPDQVLGELIGNLDSVVQDLAVQSGNVDTVITQSRAMFDQLSARRGELVGSVEQIATVADSVSTIVAEVQPDLQEFLAREPGFAQHFNDHKDSFEYFAFNLPALLKGFARVSQEGTYLSTYLCNFNVTLVPALSNVIPSIVAQATPEGRVTQSPVCR